MKAKKLWCALLGTVLVIMLIIPGNLALADNPPAMLDVLVSFYQPPGSGEIQLIQNLGGTVKTVYHIVPAVAASVPENKLNSLRRDPRVASVEEDTTVQTLGQIIPWGVDRIDAELVHPTNKGTGVKIAILDSGIDLDHPDLAVAGNVTFVSGTTNGDDDNGHGTLVAGIIGARDNADGVIGVAPEASLYAVKVLDLNGSGLMSVILSGIQWAKDNNMQVINMSFGGASQMPSTIKDALDSAYNAGIVVIAGAGEGGNAGGTGNNVWYPARYESVIAVGATDNTDARYTTSSTGYQLEVVAPGVSIYSTAMGGGYGYLTGTSGSSPHAAGVAALLISANLTNNIDIRHRLRDSAQNLGAAGWDSQFGKGIINANAAINFTEPPDQSAPTTNISLSGTLGNNGWYRSDVVVTLTAADNAGGSGLSVTKYSLDSGGSWLTYSSNFTISSAGATLVLARSWDNAGNDEGPPAFKDVKIDKTPPLPTTIYLYGTVGSNGWYVSNVNVELSGADNPGGSGIAGYQYSLDGGANWLPWSSQISVTTEGVITLLARTQDNAGNYESPPASRTFKIDKTAPVTAISLNGTLGSNNWYLSDVIITLSATDNTSGVATTEYSLNGGGDWLGYSVPFTVSAEGTTTVLARTRDNASNLESP
ncbi:MAG: S8 family serine peptidase, partial [Chloroflexota bacterium]